MWVILATAFFQVVILPGNLPFGFSQSFYSRKTSKMWLREGEGTVRATVGRDPERFTATFPAGSSLGDTGTNPGMESEFYSGPRDGPSRCPTW